MTTETILAYIAELALAGSNFLSAGKYIDANNCFNLIYNIRSGYPSYEEDAKELIAKHDKYFSK